MGAPFLILETYNIKYLGERKIFYILYMKRFILKLEFGILYI